MGAEAGVNPSRGEVTMPEWKMILVLRGVR